MEADKAGGRGAELAEDSRAPEIPGQGSDGMTREESPLCSALLTTTAPESGFLLFVFSTETQCACREVR